VQSVDAILVTVDPVRLALAEDAALEAQLMALVRLRPTLLDFARTLASESANRYPNGPFFWNEVASGFIERLVMRSTLRIRGTLITIHHVSET
jgi:AraC family transcriptional regulator